MDLPIKQLNKLLDQSENMLITGPKNPNSDVVSTAMAWHIFLSEKNKKVDMVFDGKVVQYDFLPSGLKPEKKMGDLSKFKIVLDISKTKVKQLSYDLKDKELVIDIVPEYGMFSASDVKSERGDYKYDLVFILGADSLDSLGEVFSEHRHFFHTVPIINIDNSVLNENYGQLNIVESSSTALAEISYYFFKENINKKTATCLLAGMITATNSFQSPKVIPETLEIASDLIIKGAEREKIIDSLYRTKDISTLKNWGKVLSRIKKKENIIYSFLEHDEAEFLPKDFEEMVRELILSTPGAQTAIIFYQLELHQTEVWVYTISNINAIDLIKDMGGSGYRRLAKVVFNKDIEKTTKIVIDKISKKLNIINSA